MADSEESPPPVEGGHARRRARVERRLLAEGLRLMGQVGVYGCKVEMITKAAGVGKGTFFTHFAGKEAFIARVVGQVLADLSRRVRPAGLSAVGAENLVAGVGAAHLRFFQIRPEAASLIAQASGVDREGPAGAEIRACLQNYTADLAKILAPALERMGWPRERSPEIACLILSTSIGLFSLGAPLGLGGDMPMPLWERLGRAWARGLAA